MDQTQQTDPIEHAAQAAHIADEREAEAMAGLRLPPPPQKGPQHPPLVLPSLDALRARAEAEPEPEPELPAGAHKVDPGAIIDDLMQQLGEAQKRAAMLAGRAVAAEMELDAARRALPDAVEWANHRLTVAMLDVWRQHQDKLPRGGGGRHDVPTWLTELARWTITALHEQTADEVSAALAQDAFEAGR